MSLSSTALKYIAIAAMTIDHIAFLFVTPNSLPFFIMRLFGRLTAPIVAFLIVEGFVYTKNLKRYSARLFAFAIISQPFYFRFMFSRSPNNVLEFLTNLNVLFNLGISLLILCIFKCHLPTILKAVLIGLCFATSSCCDWSYIMPVWILVFFFFRDVKQTRNILFIIASIILTVYCYLPYYDSFIQFSFMFGVILALIPIGAYNGKRSHHSSALMKKINKWTFYIFYPLHLLILNIIDSFV